MSNQKKLLVAQFTTAYSEYLRCSAAVDRNPSINNGEKLAQVGNRLDAVEKHLIDGGHMSANEISIIKEKIEANSRETATNGRG